MRLFPFVALPLLWASPAAADVIRVPDDCPSGWEGREWGHGGRCFPVRCDSDADCGAGGACSEEPIARCWRRRELPRGKSRTVEHSNVPTEQLCPDEGSCPYDGECRRARECVTLGDRNAPREGEESEEPEPEPLPATPAAPAVPEAAGGCDGCHASRGRGSGWASVLGLLALVVLGRRRFRRGTVAALLAAGGLLASSPASADAIRSPDCPDGWRARKMGHRAVCFTTSCDRDTDCEGDASCERVARCWREITVSRGGPSRGEPRPVRRSSIPTEELCDEGECEGGHECRRERECVPGGEVVGSEEPEDPVGVEAEGETTVEGAEPRATADPPRPPPPPASPGPSADVAGGCDGCVSARAPVRPDTARLAAALLLGIGLLWWWRR